jgi:hypothetical protein
VNETFQITWEELKAIVMPSPSAESWRVIEQGILKWNFPNCIRAIDVKKNIMIQAPGCSGLLYFNYKKYFSIVLLALVDANYKFIAVDVGAYGSCSDGGVFANSSLGAALREGSLQLPPDKPLPGTDEPMSHVILGNKAFPLKRYLMRLHSRAQSRDSEQQQVFNYWHSRARRVSENCFGLFVQKFCIYQRRLQQNPEHIDKVILATCVLHNFLRDDSESFPDEYEPGNVAFSILSHVRGNSTVEAMNVRDLFSQYFV